MKRIVQFMLAAMMLLPAQAAMAAAVDVDPVGYVQSARGDVVAVNDNAAVQAEENSGKVRKLFRNAALYEQDMIVTAEASKAQLMFNDGTILSVDESSQLELSQFHYEFKEKENNILDFIFGPGLFRFLTGKLVEKSPDSFKLQTPLGSVGIRGTDGAVIAQAADAPGHGSLCNELTALVEADLGKQEAATALFRKGVEFKVPQQKVYHFSGPSGRLMAFTDKATSRTVLIPRGEYLVIDVMEGAGEPQNVPLGMRGLAPSINMNIAPPSSLQGVFGSGDGDSIGKENEGVNTTSFNDVQGLDGNGGDYGNAPGNGGGNAGGGGSDVP